MAPIKRLRWISAAAWLFSWRVVYLEIFRWQHLTKTLRFNPPPASPGMNLQPKAGLPLKAVCVCAVAAPLIFLSTCVRGERLGDGDRAGQEDGQRPGPRRAAEDRPGAPWPGRPPA